MLLCLSLLMILGITSDIHVHYTLYNKDINDLIIIIYFAETLVSEKYMLINSVTT